MNELKCGCAKCRRALNALLSRNASLEMPAGKMCIKRNKNYNEEEGATWCKRGYRMTRSASDKKCKCCLGLLRLPQPRPRYCIGKCAAIKIYEQIERARKR